MSLESKLYLHLSTSTSVTAYTGTRIYPVVLPQEATYPAMTYMRISGVAQNSLSGYSTLENVRMQIDIWSTSYQTSRNIEKELHGVINNAPTFRALKITDQDFYEDELKLYRVSADFSLWNPE